MSDRPKVGAADAATRKRMLEEDRMSSISENTKKLYQPKPAAPSAPVRVPTIVGAASILARRGRQVDLEVSDPDEAKKRRMMAGALRK